MIDAGRERAVVGTVCPRARRQNTRYRHGRSTLSGGNQQKIILGRWLNANPKIFILDEPTRGIDIGAKVEIYKLLDRLAADGVAIIIISSELPEILGMSDRILVMNEGAIVSEFTRDEGDQGSDHGICDRHAPDGGVTAAPKSGAAVRQDQRNADCARGS